MTISILLGAVTCDMFGTKISEQLHNMLKAIRPFKMICPVRLGIDFHRNIAASPF